MVKILFRMRSVTWSFLKISQKAEENSQPKIHRKSLFNFTKHVGIPTLKQDLKSPKSLKGVKKFWKMTPLQMVLFYLNFTTVQHFMLIAFYHSSCRFGL